MEETIVVEKPSSWHYMPGRLTIKDVPFTVIVRLFYQERQRNMFLIFPMLMHNPQSYLRRTFTIAALLQTKQKNLWMLSTLLSILREIYHISVIRLPSEMSTGTLIQLGI